MAINPGSEQKQNCHAAKLKCAEIKSCLCDRCLNNPATEVDKKLPC